MYGGICSKEEKRPAMRTKIKPTVHSRAKPFKCLLRESSIVGARLQQKARTPFLSFSMANARLIVFK